MAVFSDPGSVPANWRPMIQDESLEMGNPVTSSDYVALETRGPANSSSVGLERRPLGYCNHCRNGKPPRCHHCSVCRRCVLKMDHHCLWVGNCLGAHNYKFFLLLLLYSFLQTIFVCLVLSHFVVFFGDARNPTGSALNINYKLLAFSENLLYALLFLVFLVKHAILTLSNTTSIEVHLKKKGVVWEYDLGRRKNFEQVFGTKKLLWFLPLYAKEDLERIPALQGLDFPVRLDVET